MVKLSDYLDYLYKEVIQARKMVDEQSVALAKEYAKHEYLKYFRVPRFTMPTVKLEIPLKIDAIDADTKYNFKMDEASYIADVNEKITKINEEKKLKIKPITVDSLKRNQFGKVVKDLEKKDFRYVKRVDESINKIDFTKKFRPLTDAFVTADTTGVAKKELDSILKESLLKQFTPISARLNNIFIDPDTTKATDKDKIMVKLNVEMVEEGLRIVSLKDENGKEFEEIVFE